MLNLLPGDRLWNRYRVESLAAGGEGAWLKELRESHDPAAQRWLLVPLEKPHRSPLAELLAAAGTALRLQWRGPPCPRGQGRPRHRRNAKRETGAQDFPLLGEVFWAGEPEQGGAAIVAAPAARVFSEFIAANGPLETPAALRLFTSLASDLHRLLLAVGQPAGSPADSAVLLAVARMLHSGAMALRASDARLIFRIDPMAPPAAVEPPPWAEYLAPELWRGDEPTPAAWVYCAARLALFGMGIGAAPAATAEEHWAALSDLVCGRRDPAHEFLQDPRSAQLPPALRGLLARCLSPGRSRRVPSPERLHALLAGISPPQDLSDAGVFAAPAASGARRPGAETVGALQTQTAVNSATQVEGLTLIPAGAFLSGEDKTPRTLRAFAIDTLPVTEGDYKRYLAASGMTPRPNGPGSRDASLDGHPVTGATWHEASAYAEFHGKRLPTIFEWEKAARGTDGRKFPFGNTYKEGTGRQRAGGERRKRTVTPGTLPAGSCPDGASPYGVLDMAGNVLQWTSSARRAGERIFRAVKGSCFLDGSVELARCTSVQYLPPETSEPYLGFRCVKDVE